MKCKRILSMLLTLCMVMSLFAGTTVTASAAGHTTRTIPLDVTTLQNITDTNGQKITPTTDSEGNQIYSCESEGWSYRLNSSKQIYELTLSGVNFDIKDTSLGWAIIAPKVILADGTENRVSTVSSNKTVAAINTQEITGSGSLTVSATSTSTASGASCYGIYANTQNLTLDQCSIVVDGVKCSNGSATGIFAAMGKTLTITANTAKDNRITIKNVQGTTTTRALGAMKPIVAEGAFVSGAKDSFTSGTTKFINFSDPGVPVIVSFVELPSKPEAATFTDGLGKTDCTFDTYAKGAENAKGYTFAGWFGDDGKELTSAADATAGTTYTAKWTKNGKTVRTTSLDLTKIGEDNTFGATLTEGVYTNADEGWSWNPGTKTLTLSSATMDIQLDSKSHIGIHLPADGILTTAANMENKVSVNAERFGAAITGAGNITVEGQGTLSVIGVSGGICTVGDITINAPISVSITDGEMSAIYIDSQQEHSIAIHDALNILTPAGGRINNKGRVTYIAESDGTTPARNVVIGSSSTSGGDTPGQITKRTIPLVLTADNITDTNGNEITSTQVDGNTIYACPAEGWSYNESTHTLTLSGADFDISNKSDRYAIKTPDNDGKIILAPGTKNNVSIHSTAKYPVMAIATTAISGDADLTVSAVADNAKCSGIEYPVDGNIPVKLEGCSITVEKVESKKENGLAYGIYAGYGSLTITANSKRDNKITIKSVKAAGTKGKAYALSGNLQMGGIIAEGATFDNADIKPIGGKISLVKFKDETKPVVLSFATNPGSENITITPATGESLTVAPGGTLQFKANVNDVTWSVRDNKSNDTKIDANGLLTVGADETASSISVIATSKSDSTKSCTVSVKIPQAAPTYTVQFNTNGGSAVGSATVSEGGKLTEPQAPTKDGYTFHGWYKDAAFTNRWNFDADTVTGNTTLYAKWTEATKIYGISGTVYAYGGTTTASGVTVKLMKGDTQVASATSAADGTYRFTGIAPGVYNIVAEKEDTTQTTLVIVTNHDETGKNVTLPQSKVNSKLTVNGADTPDVVAGGLDKEAAAVKGANSSATLVKVEMTVESKRSTEIPDADKTNIETSASGKTLEYLDIKVKQTVDGTENAITTTENMMEIVIPYDMTGKSNITVYRYHDGTAETFTENTTKADGTYYLDTVNHLIYVYTQKFSTYAIGYNTQSGGGSGSGGSSSGNSSTISTPSAKNGTVSVSPKSASKGTTVTVTVTPDKGYVLETLTVTDASGKKLDLKNMGSGKYSFTMPASKVEVKATFMEDNTMLNYFVDVPASAYYYDAVLWAAEQGITGGTDATHFSPDGVCTRAQAVTFLWRAAGSPAPSTTAMPFTDVAADSYYYNAVLWAMENGITVGTSSTTFSPDLNCSRAHIMTFLWRSEKSPAAGSVNPFTDVSADAYYADAVLWAVKESVTNGTSSATFSPDADCTRAQIVTFIWRTLAR